ncbi:MAG: hypothetical protein ACREPW_13855 [Candidatus Binataceae bacterium]
MMADDQRFARWCNWLKIVRKDVQDLVIKQHIFWEVQKIIKDNPRIQKPSSFYQWIGSAHCTQISIGIRRQLDIDTRSISLRRLLCEIKQAPRVLSRKRFLSIYKPNPAIFTACQTAGLGNALFDKYAGCNENYFPISKIECNLAALDVRGRKVKKFVNKTVAHLGTKRPTELPTFGELDTCIDLLEKLVLKYQTLFEASAPASLLPTWQFDWKAVFNEPWVPRT